MKKLDQYMIREMIVPFLIGTVVVVMMFQINTYMWLAKTFNLDNVPTSAVFQYIFYRTPEFMKMTLAVGTAMGSSLAMTRIARESELTAMRAAGIRILRVVFPVAVFGLFVAFLNFWLVEKVVPPSTKKANVIARNAAILGADSNSFRDNAMFRLGKYTMTAREMRRVGDKVYFSDLMLLERPKPAQVAITTAKEGIFDGVGIWTIKDGYYFLIEGPDLKVFRPNEKFVVNERIIIDSLFGGTMPEEQTLDELLASVASKKKLNSDTRREEIEIQSRYSIPVACLIFSVISPVFAIAFSKNGGFVGVLVAFVTVLLYYNAFVTSTQILGKIQQVPPWVAAWTPNMVFLALGVVMLRRLE
ncbi:hypothetical protein BH11ARM2_BH11ARM2_17310 [soil metagenome]